ncbi:MAG: hypothetical protein ACKO0V_01600 [bacterium]
MAEITFYRQKRRDGSIRMGLHAPGTNDFEYFDQGPDELADDPFANVLDWFIDLQVHTPTKLETGDDARKELLNLAEPINQGLETLLDQAGVGVDSSLPIVWDKFSTMPIGTTCRVCFSVSRKYRGSEYINLLKDFIENWPKYCAELRVLVQQ